MLIDTEDPVTLSHLNPLERQVLRNLADRLAMLAWQQVGWMADPARTPAKGDPGTTARPRP